MPANHLQLTAGRGSLGIGCRLPAGDTGNFSNYFRLDYQQRWNCCNSLSNVHTAKVTLLEKTDRLWINDSLRECEIENMYRLFE